MAGEILQIFFTDQWRYVKVIENPADIGNRRMSTEGPEDSGWLHGPALLHTEEEKWPKPWFQAHTVEVEQSTSTVATENKLDQLFS